MLAQRVTASGHTQSPRICEPDVDTLVHDLRGPLSVIVAFAESIEGAPREERARLVARLVANSHRALAVLEQFAALADLRTGLVEPDIRPMDLAEVARRAAQCTAEATHHPGDLDCIVPADGVPMMGDRDLLGMALRSVFRRSVADLAGSEPLRIVVAGDGASAVIDVRTLSAVAARVRIEADEFEILQRVTALHGGQVTVDGDEPDLLFRVHLPRQSQ